jgi:hypothetical protein
VQRLLSCGEPTSHGSQDNPKKRILEADRDESVELGKVKERKTAPVGHSLRSPVPLAVLVPLGGSAPRPRAGRLSRGCPWCHWPRQHAVLLLGMSISPVLTSAAVSLIQHVFPLVVLWTSNLHTGDFMTLVKPVARLFDPSILLPSSAQPFVENALAVLPLIQVN